jgi:hypothetical protein
MPRVLQLVELMSRVVHATRETVYTYSRATVMYLSVAS